MAMTPKSIINIARTSFWGLNLNFCNIGYLAFKPGFKSSQTKPIITTPIVTVLFPQYEELLNNNSCAIIALFIQNGRLREPPILLNYSFLVDYLQTPSDLQASTSAVWKSETLVGSATNTPRAVPTLLFQEGLPTTSCVKLPTTLLLAQSLAAF